MAGTYIMKGSLKHKAMWNHFSLLANGDHKNLRKLTILTKEKWQKKICFWRQTISDFAAPEGWFCCEIIKHKSTTLC